MVTDLDIARKNLETAIGAYYAKNIEIHTVIKTSIDEAVDNFKTQITVLMDEKIRKLIKDQNKDTTGPGFLMDLLLSGVVGPILGHVAEHYGKKALRVIIDNRKRDMGIANKILFDAEVKKDIIANLENSSLSKLTPGTDGKVAAILEKELVNPLNETIREKKLLKKMLSIETTIAEFIEYNSAAGNDIIQATFGKLVEKFLHNKEQTLNGLYNIKKEKGRPEHEQPHILTVIQDLKNHYSDRTRVLADYEKLLESFATFICTILPSESILRMLIQYFENEKELLNLKIPRPTNELYKKYQNYFEAFFWVLYLGDPWNWIQLKASPEFEPFEGRRYDKVEYGYDKVKISLGKDSKIVKGHKRGSGVRGEPHYSFENLLYTSKLKLNIPRPLFVYLTDHFYSNFGNENLYEEALRTKQEAMGKQEGFGINAPEPVTKEEISKIHISLFKFEFSSPYIDPREAAGILLVQWFEKISNSFAKNKVIDELIGKGFDGVPRRTFIMPNI